MKPIDQLTSDFRACIAGSILPKVGDTAPWAQGTLTRTKPGVLHYLNTVNGRFECDLTERVSPLAIATLCGAINWQWIQQYGVNLRGTKSQFSAAKESLNHVAVHGVTKGTEFPFGVCDIPPLTAHCNAPDGQVRFRLEGRDYTPNEFLQTNVYKAITGANQ